MRMKQSSWNALTFDNKREYENKSKPYKSVESSLGENRFQYNLKALR